MVASTFEVDKSPTESSQKDKPSWIIPLCVSHAAAAWGERSWEFGAGLLLLRLSPGKNELRLTAVLVLAECAMCSLLGSRIGQMVDRASFLRAAVGTLAIQSLGITAAAGFLVGAVGDSSIHSKWFTFLSIAFSVLARLSSLGSTIATEKRWATTLTQHSEYTYYGHIGSLQREVAITEEQDEITAHHPNNESLSQINALLRSIDLTCNLCAPIAVGVLLDNTTSMNAALTIASFNLLAFPIEAACLLWIHRCYRGVFEKVDNEAQELYIAKSGKCENIELSHCEGWRLYWQQPCFRSFLALAFLYLSVVGFGPLTTSWLAAFGVRPSHIGAARAIAAASGIGATVATPRCVQIFGIEGAGVRFIWWMWACIVSCTVATFYSSLWVVVVGIILSRFGRWGFDLTVTQLLQERVEPPALLGTVNGAQAALQNAFEAIVALSCVISPDPDRFVWLIMGSLGSVTIAALLHSSQHLSNGNSNL